MPHGGTFCHVVSHVASQGGATPADDLIDNGRWHIADPRVKTSHRWSAYCMQTIVCPQKSWSATVIDGLGTILTHLGMVLPRFKKRILQTDCPLRVLEYAFVAHYFSHITVSEYMCRCVCMCIYLFICMSVCVYVCVYVCIYRISSNSSRPLNNRLPWIIVSP